MQKKDSQKEKKKSTTNLNPAPLPAHVYSHVIHLAHSLLIYISCTDLIVSKLIIELPNNFSMFCVDVIILFPSSPKIKIIIIII